MPRRSDDKRWATVFRTSAPLAASEIIGMFLEWDDRKRLSNLEKHRLDFDDAYQIFGTEFLKLPARPSGDELRFRAIGHVRENLVTVIYTERGDAIRIISMRKARTDERRLHQALFD
jgi:uncharacterized DUF497 family protein